MDVLHLFFGICGNATALFLFLSPTVTFKRIIKEKSTEQFSGIPYLMTLLNCLLSTWYGLPFISPNNKLVSTTNATGAVIETVYVAVFLLYSPTKKDKLKISSLFFLVLLVFGCVALVSLFAFNGNNRKLFCGAAATTKSVEYMPLLLSVFVFLCGTCWFVYGLLGHDPFLIIPNGLGSLLGAMQLILYAIYSNKNIPVTDAEMGIHSPHKPSTV
ncbi:hypothetical protein V2J09_023741 [Rumex salicifolius]